MMVGTTRLFNLILSMLSVMSVLVEPDEDLTEYENEILEFAGEKDAPWYPSPKEFAVIVSRMRSCKRDNCQSAADFAELLTYSACRVSEAKNLRPIHRLLGTFRKIWHSPDC
jgi:hypothetical protein